MIAVQLSGGLGNQMFEYALYLKLKSLGKEVKLDDFTCYGEGQRKKQLEVFGIHARSGNRAEAEGQEALLAYDRLTKAEYIALTDSDLGLASKIRRKLSGRKDLSYREKSADFDPEIFLREPALFLGCFQTEKYFADIEDQVREAFRFRNFAPSARTKGYEEQILCSMAVSVHIRRGDYLDPKYKSLYEGNCDEAYYERAIRKMREMLPDAEFFFFSNDTAWVKEKYNGPGCRVVEGNDEDAGFADLYLMSRCRHHIIANSSFSWWGAWLNDSPEKRVIAPKRWLNGRVCSDIYTEDMILL